MKDEDKKTFWLLFLAALILYVLGAVVEPCDGHSCKKQTTEENTHDRHD